MHILRQLLKLSAIRAENNIYGPGINEVNLSAWKTFTIWRETSLQVRGDATNAFNHASFGLPNSGLTCSDPGVPCTSSALITGLTVGGRSMQLASPSNNAVTNGHYPER